MNHSPFQPSSDTVLITNKQSPYILLPSTVPDPDVIAFLTTAGITSAISTYAITNLVAGLKNQNLWNKFDYIYPFAGTTLTQAAYDLKSLAAGTFLNSPVFAESTGINFNGFGKYFNTERDFNAAVQYTLNSGSVTMHALTAQWTTDGAYWGTYDIDEIVALGHSTGNLKFGLNCAPGLLTNLTTISSSTLNVRTISVRTASNSVSFYKNGILDISASQVASNIPPFNTHINGYNFNGSNNASFSSLILNIFFVGSSLNATEVATLDSIMTSYKTNMGR